MGNGDSSVIVPRGGDATAGARGEPAIFNCHRLATVGRGAIEGRLDRVDGVAVAIDVLDGVDGVA